MRLPFSWWVPIAALVLAILVAHIFEPLLYVFPQSVSSRIAALTTLNDADAHSLKSLKSQAHHDLFESRLARAVIGGTDTEITLQLELLDASVSHVRGIVITLGSRCNEDNVTATRLLALLPLAHKLDTLRIESSHVAQCAPAILPALLAALRDHRRLVELSISGLSPTSAAAVGPSLVALLSHQPRLQLLALRAASVAADDHAENPTQCVFGLSIPMPPLQNLVDLSLRGVILSPITLQLLRPLLHWRIRSLDLQGSVLGAYSLKDNNRPLTNSTPSDGHEDSDFERARLKSSPGERNGRGHHAANGCTAASNSAVTDQAASAALLAQVLYDLGRLQNLDISYMRGLVASDGFAAEPRDFPASLGVLMSAFPRLVALRELRARSLQLGLGNARALVEASASLQTMRLLDISGGSDDMTQDWLERVVQDVQPSRHLKVLI